MTSLRFNDVMPRLQPERVSYSPGPATPSHAEDRARRALNVVVASLGLVAAAPLMLLIAAAVKLTSKGPVFYRQTRVGINRRAPGSEGGNHRRSSDFGGKPFTIYKFRTMSASDADETQVWASPDDPRVTTLGRVLRQFRLDELPQLINVIRGDMNVVGPRPEQPRIFAHLRGQVHRYAERQRVRPGITGWAQINHHYDASIEDVKRKVSLDLEYIGKQSFTEDLKIMLRTVPVVVLRKGGW